MDGWMGGCELYKGETSVPGPGTEYSLMKHLNGTPDWRARWIGCRPTIRSHNPARLPGHTPGFLAGPCLGWGREAAYLCFSGTFLLLSLSLPLSLKVNKNKT